MRPPTRQQFDNWTEKDKLWWVSFESGNENGSPGTPGFIFYKDYAIRWSFDKKGNIMEPRTMPLDQGLKEYEQATIAVKAMTGHN